MTKGLTLNKHLSRPAPRRASAAVARELLFTVGEHGGDVSALLRKAGLAHLAAALLDPVWSGELAHDEFARLYAECTWALDACASRQEGRQPLTKAEFDMLCYCIITCRTLREAIGRTATFSAMLMPRTARITLDVADGAAVLQMATVRRIRNVCAYVSDITGLSMHHRLFGWLIGEAIPLLAVEMCYPPLLDERTIFHLTAHPVRHGAPQNCLRFPAAYLDRPVIRRYAELERMIERFPFDLAQPQSKDAPLSERVCQVIGAALGSGESLAMTSRLARQFSISAATLKRRLAAEGTSLSQIKGRVRREVALGLLADHRLAIGEVARRIHFSDAAAFSRAFRQWTGQSPARWRQSQAAPGRSS